MKFEFQNCPYSLLDRAPVFQYEEHGFKPKGLGCYMYILCVPSLPEVEKVPVTYKEQVITCYGPQEQALG